MEGSFSAPGVLMVVAVPIPSRAAINLPVDREQPWGTHIRAGIDELQQRLAQFTDNSGNLVLASGAGILFTDPRTGGWLVRVNEAGQLFAVDTDDPIDPPEPPTVGDLLQGKLFESTVPVSSTEIGFPIFNLTDHDLGSRWVSQPISPCVLSTPLDGLCTGTQLDILWAADTVKNFNVQMSLDGSTGWFNIASGTTNGAKTQLMTWTTFLAPPVGRAIRLNLTDRWNTSWGNSIYDIRLTGTVDAAAPSGSISNFKVTVDSDTQATASWDLWNDSPATFEFKLDGAVVTAPSISATSKVFTGLTAGSSHTYSLQAVFTAGGRSAIVSDSRQQTGGASVSGWLSGSSCCEPIGFGNWRSATGTPTPTPVEIVATWPDMNIASALKAGGEYGTWNKAMFLEVGTGLFDKAKGHTWAAAATGAYDATVRSGFTNMKAQYNRIQRGQAYIGMFYEMNADWMPWAVRNGSEAAFAAAYKRYRVIQLEVWPEAKLGMCYMGATNFGTYINYDLRTLYPAADTTAFGSRGPTDWIGVDWYSSIWKTAGQAINSAVDKTGAPIGLSAWASFASTKGVPFGIPEWGVSSSAYATGDDPAYMNALNAYFRANGGTTAGKVLGETIFNQVNGYPDSRFGIWPTTDKPLAAAAYRDKF